MAHCCWSLLEGFNNRKQLLMSIWPAVKNSLPAELLAARNLHQMWVE
jgi:hypothetical protein